jgi:hypothetical protein
MQKTFGGSKDTVVKIQNVTLQQIIDKKKGLICQHIFYSLIIKKGMTDSPSNLMGNCKILNSSQ